MNCDCFPFAESQCRQWWHSLADCCLPFIVRRVLHSTHNQFIFVEINGVNGHEISLCWPSSCHRSVQPHRPRLQIILFHIDVLLCAVWFVVCVCVCCNWCKWPTITQFDSWFSLWSSVVDIRDTILAFFLQVKQNKNRNSVCVSVCVERTIRWQHIIRD